MCVFSQTGFSCGMRQDCTRRGCQTEVPAVRRESWCRVTGSNWQIALWSGGSGSSDIKLRLLLAYYSENPRSLKSRANGSLPLEWKSNSKAWVTQAISHNCFFLSFFFFFFHHLIPEAEKYCLEKEVLLNTLAAERCSVSPLFLDDFHPNVKVVEFSSIAQLSLTLCYPMDCSMPDPPVHHQLPELTQTHVHWVGDVILPSHPLFPLLLLPSIFPGIRIVSNESVLSIRWPNIGVSASASVLPMNIQNWFPLGLTGWISL